MTQNRGQASDRGLASKDENPQGKSAASQGRADQQPTRQGSENTPRENPMRSVTGTSEKRESEVREEDDNVERRIESDEEQGEHGNSRRSSQDQQIGSPQGLAGNH